MNYFFKKILFYFQSQTAHGLHSPLVFDLYNRVLNPHLNQKKVQNSLIEGLESFFQCSSLYFAPKIHLSSQKIVFIVDEENILLFRNELMNHPETFEKCIVVIQQPHKKIEPIWNELKASSKITFSIDIFETGILIVDKIAPKQHFKLKRSS